MEHMHIKAHTVSTRPLIFFAAWEQGYISTNLATLKGYIVVDYTSLNANFSFS